MGKHSKKNPNPNWRAEQSALTERSRLCLVHPKEAKVLRFADGRVMQRRENGQLIRITPPALTTENAEK